MVEEVRDSVHPKLGSDSKEISSFFSLVVNDPRTQRPTVTLSTMVPPTDTPWHMPTSHQPSQSAGRGRSCPPQHFYTNPVLSSSPIGDFLSPGFCPETEHREALTWLVLAPEFHAWKCQRMSHSYRDRVPRLDLPTEMSLTRELCLSDTVCMESPGRL